MPIDPRQQVDPDEVLYRRISDRSNPAWFLPNQNPAVAPEAFTPNKRDTDGISLLRANYRTPEDAVRGGMPGKNYYLARVSARRLIDLGLSLQITPDEMDRQQSPGTPGAHISVPELAYDKYQADKNRIKEIAEKISSKLSSNDVIGPYQS